MVSITPRKLSSTQHRTTDIVIDETFYDWTEARLCFYTWPHGVLLRSFPLAIRHSSSIL